MEEEGITKCHFVPVSTMERVVNFIENKPRRVNRQCKRNLLDLQMNVQRDFSKKKWRMQFKLAISRAVYSHDWNKLLYLLKKSPIWEHNRDRSDDYDFYVRALMLLLMYHPNAKSQGLLNEYLHMVLACRSDEDKKAVLKVLLTLPEKIICMTKKCGRQSFGQRGESI